MYSATILEHFRRPRNVGEIEAPSAAADASNPLCGDRVRITLRVEAGHVREARFRAEACAICTASASLLTERLRGTGLVEARRIDETQTIAALEATIRPERHRCATLPLEALQAALQQLG